MSKRLAERMKEKTLLSFEVFPPKTDEGLEKLKGCLNHLYAFRPDYISCTYGAGGTNVGKNMDVCRMILEADNDTVPVTHFTCIGGTKEDIKEKLQNYLDNGIDHMLAVRGDFPDGWTGTGGEFSYAVDLVRFVRREFGDKFEIAVAGSPEGHISCRSLEADIAHLKQKQDEGADYIMTQLTFDMEQFEYWLDAIRSAGITMPVDVGVMPVLNRESVINMCLSRNGCAIPRRLAEIISRHWFDTDAEGKKRQDVLDAFRKEGIEYTVDQILQYMALGVEGIHLYALNTWKNSTEILEKAGIRSVV